MWGTLKNAHAGKPDCYDAMFATLWPSAESLTERHYGLPIRAYSEPTVLGSRNLV
jgi:hypothetical protein